MSDFHPLEVVDGSTETQLQIFVKFKSQFISVSRDFRHIVDLVIFATKNKWKFRNSKLCEKSQNQKFAKARA